MKKPTQLFFSRDEKDAAYAAADCYKEDLFKIVDCRTKADRPLMFVLTLDALECMYDAKMIRRMWVWLKVARP